jgi:hypothetical protein
MKLEYVNFALDDRLTLFVELPVEDLKGTKLGIIEQKVKEHNLLSHHGSLQTFTY